MSVEQSENEKNLEPSAILQEIVGMNLSFSDEEFRKVANQGSVNRATSEDAFLRIAKKLIAGEKPTPNTQGAMLRILERDSMRGHPHMELFRQSVDELTGKV